MGSIVQGQETTDTSYRVGVSLLILVATLVLARIWILIETENRMCQPTDFVVLEWSDVPQKYTVHRPPGFGNAEFAAFVIAQDRAMHEAFLSMRGR